MKNTITRSDLTTICKCGKSEYTDLIRALTGTATVQCESCGITHVIRGRKKDNKNI